MLLETVSRKQKLKVDIFSSKPHLFFMASSAMGMEWACNGVEWNGVEWNRKNMGRNGFDMERNGMDMDMERNGPKSKVIK